MKIGAGQAGGNAMAQNMKLKDSRAVFGRNRCKTEFRRQGKFRNCSAPMLKTRRTQAVPAKAKRAARFPESPERPKRARSVFPLPAAFCAPEGKPGAGWSGCGMRGRAQTAASKHTFRAPRNSENSCGRPPVPGDPARRPLTDPGPYTAECHAQRNIFYICH